MSTEQGHIRHPHSKDSTLLLQEGVATVTPVSLCPKDGIVGPITEMPINATGTTVGEAAKAFGAAAFIDYVHTGVDIDQLTTDVSLGVGFAPHIPSRYISLTMPEGGHAIAFNVPHIEPGMEEHMIGVALWAQFLKRLRAEDPSMLAYTFYEGDSGWRTTTDPVLNVMATSFTTSLVGGFSNIGDEKEREVVLEVHAHEVEAGMPEELIEKLRTKVRNRVRKGIEEGKSPLEIVLETHNALVINGYMDRRNTAG